MAREAFREADNDERIKRALKSRIQASNHNFFTLGDRVYFKEIKKTEWSGPGKVLGQDGKVIFIRYGNRLKRVHSTRVLRAGEEYNSINPIEDDADHNHVETIENNKATIDEEKVITETVKEDADIRVKRKSSIRRPNKNRKIKFKKINDERWMSGEVKNVGDNIGTNQFKCSILLENDDLKEVDFSDRDFTWEYEQEQCETCHKGFDNRKGLKRHQLLIHQDNDNYECEQCSIKINNLDALKKHKQTVHVENTQQNKTV